MEINLCHIHPDAVARTQCFQCEKHLCHQCRLLLGRYFFCSQKCHQQFRLHNHLNYLKKHKLGFVIIWNLLLSIGVVWLVASVGNRGKQISSTPLPTVSVNDSTGGVESSVELSRVIESLSEATVASRSQIHGKGGYQVSIPVERGWVVSVWRNNWPVVSEIVAKEGNQYFEIPLKYGDNRIRLGVWDEQQKLVFQDYFDIAYKNRMVELLRKSVYRGSEQRRNLALTFDGGSMINGAQEILAILAENGIVTTMFITGQFIEKYPELVLEMIYAGHEIANHTYNHPHLTTFEETGDHTTATGVTRKFLIDQLVQTDSLFQALTGCRMLPFWRAPYGEINQEILDWAAEAGYLHVGWTQGFDTHDWVTDTNSPIYKTPEAVYQAILEKDNGTRGLNGAIILMHLGTERESEKMFSMLPDLLDDLQHRGYNTVPISKLLNP